MKTYIYIGLIFIIVISSCKKENEDYSSYPNNYPIINIDTLAFTYIDNDTNYFFEGNFNSINHTPKFNVRLLEGRLYRFYASQKYSNLTNIALSLINADGDTVSSSQITDGQHALLFNAHQDLELILQAQLQNENNVSLDYRIFFEERQYEQFSHLNNHWQSYGRFDKINNGFKFIPSFSNRSRWLMLDKKFDQLNSVSFTIEANGSEPLSFSFAIAQEMNAFDFNSEQLISRGVYNKVENTTLNSWINNGTISPLIEEQSINNINNSDTSLSVKIEKNPDISGELLVYFNQVFSHTIQTDLSQKYLYIHFEDRSENENIVKNTEVINN